MLVPQVGDLVVELLELGSGSLVAPAGQSMPELAPTLAQPPDLVADVLKGVHVTGNACRRVVIPA